MASPKTETTPATASPAATDKPKREQRYTVGVEADHLASIDKLVKVCANSSPIGVPPGRADIVRAIFAEGIAALNKRLGASK